MEKLVVGSREFSSRLLVGTGKYKDFQETQDAIVASGAEIVTVAIRRTNIGQNKEEPNLLDFLNPEDVVEAEQTMAFNNAELLDALKGLDDRSKDIIRRRYLSDSKVTLHELAEEYKISAERIRQIENGALKKLRSSMTDAL